MVAAGFLNDALHAAALTLVLLAFLGACFGVVCGLIYAMGGFGRADVPGDEP